MKKGTLLQVLQVWRRKLERHYEQLYAYTVDNVDTMDTFLEKHTSPKLI